MHRLLERQLRKHLGRTSDLEPALQALLGAVDDAYQQSDADRLLIERSMELSSRELLARNRDLADAEAKYRSIFENATEGIFQITPARRYLSANPAMAHMLGYDDPASFMGAVTDVATQLYAEPGRRDEIEEELGRSGAIAQCESQFRRRDGTPIWISETMRAVRDAAGRIAYFEGTARDISKRKAVEEERQALQSRFIEISRRSGMADVATSVLHNIGNVLNSTNVSLEVATRRLRGSRTKGVAKVAELLIENRGGLAAFFAEDGKGKQIPDYLSSLARHLGEEQRDVEKELASLAENLEHIKRIVTTQQSYAKAASGLTEIVRLPDLVEDALRLNRPALERADVEVVRDFQPLPSVNTDRHHVLQILVNLISNACHAMQESQRAGSLTIRVAATPGDARRFAIQVTDTGVGIPKENLTRIFNHGFTTKPDGHGFGLHGSALAASALGGSLAAHSDGPGAGATFTLELPAGSERGLGSPQRAA